MVDALVYERLIVDDTSSMAEIHYRQVQGGRQGLLVLLEELA